MMSIHPMAHRRRLLQVAVTLGICLFSSSFAPRRLAPSLIYWAWEKPEDLRGLAGRAGVAYLAESVVLVGDEVRTTPRFRPLRVDPDTYLIAVARIETDLARPPVLAPDQMQALARRLASLANQSGVRAVQIDFDATGSERALYRRLILDTRAALGRVPLSITALASWCMFDDWIRDLPVDEVVPMLFQMGPSISPAQAARSIRVDRCRTSVGIATDEPIPALSTFARTYVFSSAPWTPERAARVASVVEGGR